LNHLIKPQHFVRARSYAPIINFVLVASEVSVDAEIAN